MIVDKLENSEKYVSMNSKFPEAFEYIRKLIADGAGPGNYVAEEGVIFGAIQDAMTVAMEEAKFEGHYKFIDVQVVLKGTMDIYVKDAEGLAISEDLTPKRDLLFFERPNEWTTVRLYAGDFAVLYPGEAHAPGVASGEPGTVRKMVLKVPAIL